MRWLLFLLVALGPLGWGRSAALAETRVALVVGNSAYQSTTPLSNPLNDARDMAAALKGVGFEVVEALDADRRKLDGALRVFTDKLASDTLGIAKPDSVTFAGMIASQGRPVLLRYLRPVRPLPWSLKSNFSV